MDSSHNPTDIGSRGCKADQMTRMWQSGPECLLNPKDWPRDIVTTPNKETEAEAKRVKEIFAAAVEGKDDFDDLLEKHVHGSSDSSGMAEARNRAELMAL